MRDKIVFGFKAADITWVFIKPPSSQDVNGIFNPLTPT